MVLVRANLQKGDLVAVSYVQTNVTQNPAYPLVNHRTPVLGGTDQVVQEDGDVVAFVDVLTHTPS